MDRTRSRAGGDGRTARNPARPMAKVSQRRRLTSTQGVPGPEGGEPRRTKAAEGRPGRRPNSGTDFRAESGQNYVEATHEVVVREGRVYDAFTGHQGLTISEYKALWEHHEVINFGF